MGRHFFVAPFIIATFLLFFSAVSHAKPPSLEAKQAVLLDGETGSVLFSKNGNDLVEPASLAKIMTMEATFHALKSGQVSLDDKFKVSENAWRTGGAPSRTSTMFAQVGSKVRLEDLILGAIVQSANDGCIAIAEGLANTQDEFAQLMTRRAREIGLEQSVFKNATGLPAKGQFVTMHEMAKLARHVWQIYPEFYPYFAKREFTWNKISQNNRNPLFSLGIGADGLKTGYTKDTGYAIVGSVEKNGRRLFVALSGLKTKQARAQDAKKLLKWGLESFKSRVLFSENETIGTAEVFAGAKATLDLVANHGIVISVPKSGKIKLTARIVYQGPIKAPIEKGQQVGHLKIWLGKEILKETPLFAAESIEIGDLQQRALGGLSELALGWMR